MNLLVALLILGANLVVTYKDASKGLVVYIIFSLISPNYHIGATILSYEIIAFLPVFFIFLIKQKEYKITIIEYLLVSYTLILAVSTFLSYVVNDTRILWIAGFGHVRFVLVFFALAHVFRKEAYLLQRIMLAVIVVNTLLSIIQLMLPKSIGVFYKLYYKAGLTPLAYFLEMGEFTRATGTFGSPINLGAVALVAFAYFYGNLIKGGVSRPNIIGIIAALITGTLSLSKLFILGVPILLLLGLGLKFIFSGFNFKFLNRQKALAIVKLTGVIGVIAVIFIKVAEKQGFLISYYFGFLTRPLDAFITRYNLGSGNLATTIKVVKENAVLGVGKTQPMGEFIGDSAYIVTLHDTGIIGTMLFLAIFFLLLKEQFKVQQITGILLTLTLMLSGLAFTSFVHVIGAIVIAYGAGEMPKLKTFKNCFATHKRGSAGSE